jgi:hypothetical protein
LFVQYNSEKLNLFRRDLVERILTMDCDEAIKYIKNNVKTYDILNLSYNRVYTPGEVINIETEDCAGKKSCRVLVQLTGDTLTSTVEVDLEEIKDDLVEIKHITRDKSETTVITIEKCEI